MPTDRIKRVMENRVPKHYSGEGYSKPIYLSILRSRYFTEIRKKSEVEPMSIWKAKALSNYLDNVPIFIRPDELIVGYHSEDPHALPVSLETFSSKVIEQYIEKGFIKQEEEDEWHQYLDYWRKRNLESMIIPLLSEKEVEIAKAQNVYMEVLPSEYTSRAMPDHDLYLKLGLNGILKMLKEKLDSLEKETKKMVGGPEVIENTNKINDLKAMIIASEAVIRWAKRYSNLAEQMAKNEKNLHRKQELMKISEICANVPANPASSFWESLQSHWFVFLVYHIIEHQCHGTSLRLDQVFWPWYERDIIINSTLKRNTALEILENFLIHIDELGRPLPLWRHRTLQGNNFLGTFTIGGTNAKDGTDACNELTLLILDALDDLKINHPDFKFRWHPKINPKVWKRITEVIRTGLGQPSIKNEQIAIDYLMGHYGFNLEEARSWAVVGCISPAPTIRYGRCRRDAWGISPLKIFELTLNNGVETVAPSNVVGKQVGLQTGNIDEFLSFEELFEAFRQQFAYFMSMSARIKSISEHCNNQICKRPFLSSLCTRSLESCRDIMDTQEKGMPWVNDPGIVDTVDSLIAIKKLIYDDKKYTMSELMEALKADWNEHEVMRQVFINEAPKFGNNDDYADEVAVRTYSMVAEEMSKVRDINGASPMPSGLVITRMWLLADKIGALPNGRRFGDPLADGGISPHAGYDRNGPMAAILSTSKIDSRKQKANIFNQTLTPSSLEGEVGLKKFSDYITAAMNLGLDMIQFNIVDGETLKAAQKEPEKYQNLIVRVSGYNARFIDLDKFVQDAVIGRTQNQLQY